VMCLITAVRRSVRLDETKGGQCNGSSKATVSSGLSKEVAPWTGFC